MDTSLVSARTLGRFRSPTHTNGDTEVELLTRSKYLLSMSGDKWSERQKARADILFERHPKINESHSLLCSMRSVFSRNTASLDDGREKLQKIVLVGDGLHLERPLPNP